MRKAVPCHDVSYNGPLDRKEKLWVAHALGMPGNASRHVRLARTVMHAGIAN